jgi:3'-5' exoribonuclease
MADNLLQLPATSTTATGLGPSDLKRLALGERLEEPLRVIAVDQRDSPRGPYTILVLGNGRGQLPTAPFWAADQARLRDVARGAVVRVAGEIAQYLGKRQLKVSAIEVVPAGSAPWQALLPSVGEVGRYWEALDRWRLEIRGPRLRRTLDLFYADPGFRRNYQTCPASTAGHHAAIGGLLRHTWEVAAIGRGVAATMGADRDLVTAGALLHDIGKLEAYRWEVGFETTEAGALLGHVVLGLLMLDRRLAGAATPPCEEAERMVLHHLVASHHGRLEFGAAVPPMTIEAEVLHFADNASAKAASMAEALADPELFAGDALVTSRSVWQLDKRRVYRGRCGWGLTGTGAAGERSEPAE